MHPCSFSNGGTINLILTLIDIDIAFSCTCNNMQMRIKMLQKAFWNVQCGPVPNVMAALPNIGGALCSTLQSLADAHYCRVPCSNTTKTRNPLKFAMVPQTGKLISAVSRLKFAILWGDVWEILLLDNFFLIVDTCLSCKDIARQSCAMVPRWRIFGDFLRSVFSASRVRHVSDLHPKFVLRPATPCVEVWQTSNLRPLRLGEEKKKDRYIGR